MPTTVEICAWCQHPLRPGEPAHVVKGSIACGACNAGLAHQGNPARRQAALIGDAVRDAIATSRPAPGVAPAYGAVSALATLLNILGLLQIVGVVIIALVLVIRAMAAEALAAALPSIAMVFFGGLFASLLMLAASQLLTCIRDIAINSFGRTG